MENPAAKKSTRQEEWSFLRSGCSRGHAYSLCHGKNKRNEKFIVGGEGRVGEGPSRGKSCDETIFPPLPRVRDGKLNERFYFVAAEGD